MQTMSEYLTQLKTSMPAWLEKFNPHENSKPDLKEVLNSRVVFYPACYCDGFMVEVFNPSHSAYVYLYADYAMTEEEWIEILGHRNSEKAGLAGMYSVRLRMEISEAMMKSHTTIILLKKLFLQMNGFLILNIPTVLGTKKDSAAYLFLSVRKIMAKTTAQNALLFFT